MVFFVPSGGLALPDLSAVIAERRSTVLIEMSMKNCAEPERFLAS
jgi:hypothetical protein